MTYYFSLAASLPGMAFKRALSTGPRNGPMDVDASDPPLAARPEPVTIDLDAAQPQKRQSSSRFWKQQYMGTWSHTDCRTLTAPKDMAKAIFGNLLLRLLTAIFRAAADEHRARLHSVTKVSVFAEHHANGHVHYHFPVLAEYPWSPDALQSALRAENIAVDFSKTHEYYWTTFVYLAVPGVGPEQKQEQDLDHEPWLSPEHPAVAETIKDIPRGARASDKAKVRRWLHLEDEEAQSNHGAAFTDKEFAKQLVAKNIRTKTALQAWVAEESRRLHAQRTPKAIDERLVIVGMEAYMYKNQNDLERRITFAWEVHLAPEIAALAQLPARTP